MVSLVFQINAIVMANGSKAKKTNVHKPSRLSQKRRMPGSNGNCEAWSKTVYAMQRNKKPTISQQLSEVNRRISCRSVSAGNIAASCLRTTVKLNKKSTPDSTSTKIAASKKNSCGILLCQ